MADQDARRLLDGFNPLPLHPLIHHQPHPILKLHDSLWRDGFALDHIQMKAVMQLEHLALHAWGDNSGLAFDLDCFIPPDDEVADLEVEGFFLPGVHGQLSQVLPTVAFNPLQA